MANVYSFVGYAIKNFDDFIETLDETIQNQVYNLYAGFVINRISDDNQFFVKPITTKNHEEILCIGNIRVLSEDGEIWVYKDKDLHIASQTTVEEMIEVEKIIKAKFPKDVIEKIKEGYETPKLITVIDYN